MGSPSAGRQDTGPRALGRQPPSGLQPRGRGVHGSPRPGAPGSLLLEASASAGLEPGAGPSPGPRVPALRLRRPPWGSARARSGGARRPRGARGPGRARRSSRQAEAAGGLDARPTATPSVTFPPSPPGAWGLTQASLCLCRVSVPTPPRCPLRKIGLGALLRCGHPGVGTRPAACLAVEAGGLVHDVHPRL